MIRVVIADDEPLARARMRKLLLAHADVVCVAEATHGREALSVIEKHAPDVAFLDIQMPELDGLRVAEQVARAANAGRDAPKIVFTTAFDDYAIRAFELAAVDYLPKPVRKERLAEALARIRSAAARGDFAQALELLAPKPSKVALRLGAKYSVFNVDAISAIFAANDLSSVRVHDKEYLSDDSLDTWARRLPAKFVRVHRSSIVNLDFVKELEREGDRKFVAVLSDPTATRVAVSRERLDEVKRRLGANG